MLLRHLRLGVAAALLPAVWLSACSGCTSNQVVQHADAGADAHVLKDASRDRNDATDVDLPDADFDAGFNPFVGNWGPLKNAPSNCNVKVDYSPQKDISSFTWTSCASGNAGCQRLVIDWTKGWGSYLGFEWQPVKTTVNGPLLSYGRSFVDPKSVSGAPLAGINVVSDLAGHAFAAFGDFGVDPLICGGRLMAADGNALFAMITINDSQLLGRIPLTNPAGISFGLKSNTDFGTSGSVAVQRMDTSGSVLLLDILTLALYDTAQDKMTLVRDQNQLPIPAEDPIAVKGGMLAQDTSDTQGLWFVGLDGSAVRAYTPKNGNLVFAEDVDSTNNDTFVWMEGQQGGFDYTDITLYTSPYANQKDGVVPTRVRGMSTLFNYGGFMVANAGMALILTSATTAQLIRLSDGWGWAITAEATDNWGQALWVDDNEVWLAVTSAASGGAFLTDIVKYSRATLGAPTIPPN